MQTTIDNRRLREVAGAFATGITIVTVTKKDGSIYGMTANSFLSVSLEPALVAFSVREQGKMMQYITEGQPIGISILSDEQESISNQFAGQNATPIKIDFDYHDDGVQTIAESLAWYTTTVQNIIPAGDHFIILCEVLDLHRDENRNPLLYYSGYKSLAS